MEITASRQLSRGRPSVTLYIEGIWTTMKAMKTVLSWGGVLAMIGSVISPLILLESLEKPTSNMETHLN